MISVAILDDYQGVALSGADWSPLAEHAEITVFRQHHADVDELTTALRDFDVVVGMRERTAFPADVLRRLPRLRLLITTGARNASFDLTAAAAHGVTVCGTRTTGTAAPELTWGLILALTRQIVTEDAAVRAGRRRRWSGRCGSARSPAPRSTSSTASRSRSTIRCAACRTRSSPRTSAT